MSFFQEIRSVEDERPRADRRNLFSAPSNLVPHTAERVRIKVKRYHVGTVCVGQVTSSGHDVKVSEPSGATLLVPVRGRIVSAPYDGASQDATRGEALFFSPNKRQTRVETSGTPGFAAIPIIIPRSELRASAERLGARAVSRRGLPQFALHLVGARTREARNLIDCAHSLHDAVACDAPQLLRGEAHRSWSRLLSDRMVELLASADILDLPTETDTSAASRHARRAMEYMEAHYSDITTISEIADACGIGLRSLETSFRNHWSLTAQQALLEIRLLAARRLLLCAEPGERVTDIAFQCGFNHLGRFAAQYRGRFGESPSQTMMRSRH